MAKRIENRQASSPVKRCAIVVGISACLVSLPAFADSDGSVNLSAAQDLNAGGAAPFVEVSQLSYEDALDAYQKTKDMTKAAEAWKPRTYEVPQGSNPDLVIQKNANKVPGIHGMTNPSPDVSKISAAKIKINGSLEQAQKVQIPGASAQAPSPGTQEIEERLGWQQQPPPQRPVSQPIKRKQTTGLTTVFDVNQPISEKANQ